MSIEKNIERIAISLETIASQLTADKQKYPSQTDEAETPVAESPKAETPVAESPKAETAPPPPTKEQPVAEAPPAPPVTNEPAPTLSPSEMNAKLVAEVTRLGGREPIDNVLKEFGALKITDLKPEQYQEVLDKVATVTV